MKFKQQNGVGLIEVLVSLLVISTGILGLIGLQTLSLKRNAEALAFAQANQLASDMFERIRTNPAYAISGAGYQLEFSDVLETELTCTESCTAANMAIFDTTHWQQKVANNMPGGQAQISITPLVATHASAMVTIQLRYLHSEETSITGVDSDYEVLTFSARI